MRRPRVDSATRVPILDTDPEGPEIPARPRAPSAPDAPHVELCAATAFSFLTGASQPEEIVAQSVAMGFDCVGIADAHGLYGVVRAHAEARRLNARIILGAALQVELPGGEPGPVVILHPATRAAYARLCRLITRGHHGRPKGFCRVRPEDVCNVAGDMFATVLPPLLDMAEGDDNGFAAPLEGQGIPAPRQDRVLRALKDAYGGALSVALVRRLGADDAFMDDWARQAERFFGVRLLATTRPLMHGAWRKPAQDVLTCIRLGVRIHEAGTLLLPNAEARLLSPAELSVRYVDVPDALERSREIADACRFSLSDLRYRFPADRLLPGETPNSRLRALTFEGARRRYGGTVPDAVTTQLLHELTLIETMDVAPYFLTVHDIVETARARHILCQGRGSAANSAVCYVLGITSVDPVRMQLLFERFLSVERNEPPDIDVDFEHERREEVIQDIYNRWGREHAGMVCEVICYRGKSAMREAGKVAGLDPDMLDRLSNVMTHSSLKDMKPERIRETGLNPESPDIKLALFMARALQGSPRHIGVHVGGFVLTHDALIDTVPIEPAAMEKRTVIQWDKDDLDVVGLFKMDVLGLGMLTALRKTMDLVRHSGGPAYELWSLPPEDPATYAAIQKADTVGVFQIESRAQMAMLPRLRPGNFYDLVIEVAIVRPGPIQGDMVHPYLRRRRGEEPVEYPHPALVSVLQRTLGVPLFQEQVMRIAIVGAGYSPGEADQLRRDMAAWKKNGRLARHRQKLIDGFGANGISREFAERLYAQVLGFGEYGFPESHAASFALLTYASSYLKVHHPAAFAAALINSQPMGFYSASSILQDAQRHGVKVLPIDVLHSHWDCTLERQPEGVLAVRVGFRLIKGLARERVDALLRRRDQEGGIHCVEDVMGAAAWRPQEVFALTGSGALRSLSADRREALWEGVGVETARADGRLTTGVRTEEDAPLLPGLSPMEVMLKDYAYTGLSVDDHPLRHLRESLRARRVVTCAELAGLAHGTAVKVAGLAVTRQRPQTASGVVFVTLEDETGTANVVLWARIFDRFHRVARNAPIMEVRGRLERDGNVIHVIAQHLSELHLPTAELQVKSRDFH